VFVHATPGRSRDWGSLCPALVPPLLAATAALALSALLSGITAVLLVGVH